MATLEKVLVLQCAPTLAGLKVANLFRFTFRREQDVFKLLAQINAQLNQQDVYLELLSYDLWSGAALLYVYRASWLEQLLQKQELLEFLHTLGYKVDDTWHDLVYQLSLRLAHRNGFPHEIGIFLGYPLEDVRGFIEHAGKGYTFCGCWKSYGDGQEAECFLERCRKCMNHYMEHYAQGMSLSKLAVAV